MRTAKTVFTNCGQHMALDQAVNIKPIWMCLPNVLQRRYQQLVHGKTPTWEALEEAVEERHASKLDYVGQWVLEEE